MTGQARTMEGWWRRTLGLSLLVPALLMLVRGTSTAPFYEWFWSELGPIETSHVLIPLLATGIGLMTFCRPGRLAAAKDAGLGWLAVGMLGLSALCFVVAGEEASWGQHLIGWSTPEGWSEVNDQQETNLHNASSWADQKPRAIIEVGIIVFGIVWPIWHLLTSTRIRAAWATLLPPTMVLPVAIGGELSRLLEAIPRYLGVSSPSAFPRPSELQEFYFYTFFALCMWTWRQRLVNGLAAAEERAVTIPLPQSSQQSRRAA